MGMCSSSKLLSAGADKKAVMGTLNIVLTKLMESNPSISEEEVADRFLALCAKQEDENDENM